EITLKGLVTVGSGNYSYKWTSNSSSPISGSTAAEITVKPSETTAYSLTVVDNDTKCIASSEVIVTVIPAPTIQFSIPDQEICSGESTQLVSLTTSPAGESIAWTSEAAGVTGVTEEGTNEIPVQTLTNKTGQQIKIVYTALIPNSSQGNCTLIPAKYTIIVNPEPS